MKTKLMRVMTFKVHYLLFVLACALLVSVAVRAKMIANDIEHNNDKAMEQGRMPIVHMPRI